MQKLKKMVSVEENEVFVKTMEHVINHREIQDITTEARRNYLV